METSASQSPNNPTAQLQQEIPVFKYVSVYACVSILTLIFSDNRNNVLSGKQGGFFPQKLH